MRGPSIRPAHRHERSLPSRLPPRAGRRDPGLVHAPGRTRAPRVPGDPRAGDAGRDHPRRRPLRRGHAAAGPPARGRRGDPLRRHHDAVRRPRSRLRHRRGARTGRRRARPHCRRRRPPSTLRARGARRPAPRGDPPGPGRAPPVPLIGFAGAPFTLACYLVEGGPSRASSARRRCMHAEPEALGGPHGPSRRDDRRATSRPRWRPAPRPSRCSTRGSAPSAPPTIARSVAPWMARIFAARRRAGRADHPLRGGLGRAPPASRRPPAATSIGLDWRIDLADGWGVVGPDHGVQGNLDPTLLLGPCERGRRPTPGPSSRRPAAGPVTSSTSATASCRAPIPTPSPASSTSSTTTPCVPRRHREPRMTADAVLLMAYGSPDRLDQVEAYYTDIRRGSPPPAHLLEELLGRYQAIGGGSPLSRIVELQRAAVETELARRGRPSASTPGCATSSRGSPRSSTGWSPTAFERFARSPWRRKVVERSAATDEPSTPPLARLDGTGPRVVFVDSWHDQPRFIEALAATTAEALRRFPDPSAVRVLFTAHSLPARVVADGDPYPDELAGPPALVAERLGLASYDFAFQSAGRTDEPWLGPDILEEIRRLGRRWRPRARRPSRRLRRRPPRGALRHRHRGPGRRPRGRRSASSGPGR